MNIEAVLARPGVTVERRPSPYRTSHPLEEIDIVLEDGSSLALIRKDLRRAALDETARRAKPEFLHDPLREIEAYRLLAAAGLGTPRVYDQGADWLLLERVAGVELYQRDELEAWQRAAAWLARLHRLFAETPPASPHLLRYDADYYRGWADRARAFVGAQLDPVVARYDAVIERLCALPTTFIHGEFFASNVLVAAERVAPIDWEMAAIGPGLIDLAALTSGRWSEDERWAIAAAYGDLDREAFECCHLHLALQWLGWSSDWTPPAEHAHDWLGEAQRAASWLGL